MSKAFRLTYRPNGSGKRPAKPLWLLNCESTKRAAHSTQYWTKIYWATPPWLDDTQLDQMKEIYLTAPVGQHIDHIVPLKSPLVCGLHVPWNLEVLPEAQNLAKSNHLWPHHPFRNHDLFELVTEPFQFSLNL